MKLVSILVAAAALAFSLTAMAQSDDSILVDKYIISQEFIEAEVVRVSSQDRTITVRGAKRGQTRRFSVPEDTRITVDGKEARLRDIRRGDMVMLATKRKAEEVVVARIRVPETDKSLEQRRANPVVAESKPAMLPKTASNQPMFLLFGLLALLAATGLRLSRQ